METWDESFDVARRAEIARICGAVDDAERALAWRALVVAIAPHVERLARYSPLLRHCGLTGEDEPRWVLVESLERLSRRGHENLRAFLARQPPTVAARARDPLDTLGDLLDAEDQESEDTVAAVGTEGGRTPFRGWLLGLVRFAKIGRASCRERV